jgi:FKBP-type peptidyl-prolyl cis-trans isomerase FklB
MKGDYMKKLSLIVALSIVFFVSQVSAEEKLMLKDQKDKVSYSIGLDIGKNLKKQSIDVNADAFARGLKDALSGGDTLMTEQEINETMAAFQKEMMAKQAERLKTLGEKNEKEGEAFLAENKKKESVITLPSGLQYKVIKEGTGEIPTLNDTVTIQYRGTLIDGTEFDSSHGQPATFRVNGVIPGLSEALQLMKTGSKWQLFIPSKLAYGNREVGRNIGPNTTLIFEVELLSFTKGEKFHTDQMRPNF